MHNDNPWKKGDPIWRPLVIPFRAIDCPLNCLQTSDLKEVTMDTRTDGAQGRREGGKRDNASLVFCLGSKCLLSTAIALHLNREVQCLLFWETSSQPYWGGTAPNDHHYPEHVYVIMCCVHDKHDSMWIYFTSCWHACSPACQFFCIGNMRNATEFQLRDNFLWTSQSIHPESPQWLCWHDNFSVQIGWYNMKWTNPSLCNMGWD